MNISIIVSIAGVIISGLVSLIVASLKIGTYQNKVDNAETEITSLKAQMRECSTKLTECSTKIDERTRSYASTLTKSESPVALTPQGKDLLSRSGSNKFVVDNQAELIEKIKAKDPHSAYDVQVFAKAVIEDMQNDPKFRPLKDFAFNEGLELEPIILVMSIFLRDIALASLGYRPEDVDKTTPNIQKEK